MTKKKETTVQRPRVRRKTAPVAFVTPQSEEQPAKLSGPATTSNNVLRTIARYMLIVVASGVLTAGVDAFANVQSDSLKALIQTTWAAVLLYARTYVEQRTGKGVLIQPPVTQATLSAAKTHEIGGA